MSETLHSAETIERLISGIHPSKWFKDLAQLVAGDDELRRIDPVDLYEKVKGMHNRDEFPHSADGAFETLKKEFGSAAHAAANDITKDNPFTDPSVKRNFADRFKLDDVTLSKGLSLLLVGMAAFGAFSSAQHIVSKDEQGHDKVNFTPLAWTLGQGALAAGTAYLALRNPQMVAAASR